MRRKHNHISEEEGDVKRDRAPVGLRSHTEWKERRQRGYGERTMGGGGDERERFVCFFTTLCGLLISWEEVREMVGLFFSFCSFLGFCFSLRFLQTNRSPFFYPPRDGNFKLSSVALLSPWKKEELNQPSSDVHL